MAKVNNKGIYIDFGLDIKSFTQEKNKLMGEIRELQRGLSQIDKQLKFDPTNVTLLKTRITQLKTEINSLTERQKIWANTLEEANKAVERGDLSKTSEQYRTIAIECSKATTQLEYYKNELIDTERALGNNDFAIEKFGKNLDSSKDSALSLADVIKANLTSDLLMKGLEGLAGAVKKVGSAFAESVKYVYSNGIQYNMSMETYSKTLHAIGLNSDESSDSIDKLIKSMKDLGSKSVFGVDRMMEAATQLTSSGISAEDTTKALTSLAKSLAYAGKGGDELTRMAQNLNQIQNAGKAAATDLKQFAYAGVPIFKLLADYSDRFKNGVDSKHDPATYEDIVGALNKAAEEGAIFYDALDVQAETLYGQLQMVKNGWNELLGAITLDTTNNLSTTVLPAVNDFLTKLSEAFNYENVIDLALNNDNRIGGKKFIDAEEGYRDKGELIAQTFAEGFGTLIEKIQESGLVDDFFTELSTIIQMVGSLFDESTEQGKKNKKAFEDLVVKIGELLGYFVKLYEPIFVDIGLTIGKAIVKGIKSAIKEMDMFDGYGSYADMMTARKNGGSLGFGLNSDGYGALNSGGFASGGITLNASFNVSGSTSFDRATAIQFAEMLTDEINEGLGGLYR